VADRALAPRPGDGAARPRLGAALGAVQIAGPFLLIGLGEEHVTSSLAGILVSAAPIFTALMAIRFDPSERARG
jgi:drug/metabolite transporter (DMT)-like permease